MSPPFLRALDGAIELSLQIQPRASRTRFVAPLGEWMKVQVAAPPVDGEANETLVEFLADAFRVPRRDVELVSGHTGRRKRVRIRGVAPEAALVVMQVK